MGAIVSFECGSCGYVTGELGLGPAPFPERYDPVLVSCPTCRSLKVVHAPDVGKGCACGAKLRVRRGTDRVSCPRCRKRMTSVMQGLWD